MKFIRKALLPAVIAAGFLGFLGAIGPSTPTVSAANGDVCAIVGGSDATKTTAPKLFIEEGETVYYTAIVENFNTGFQTIDVDLNDFDGGDSDITSLYTASIPETDFLNDVALKPVPATATNPGNICGKSDSDLVAATSDALFDFLIDGVEDGEVCDQTLGCTAPSPPDAGPNEGGLYHTGINDEDIDCGYVATLGLGDNQCVVSSAMLRVVANEIAAAMVAVGATPGNCANDFSGMADDVALEEDATEFVSFQVEDYIQDVGDEICFATARIEGYITVDVTCDDPGVFDLSFAVNGGGAKSIEVVCGSDADTAEIFAAPTSVEINPSIANVAHSLVWISIKGNNGQVAFPGTEVQWTTDRCAIESTTVDTEDEFEAAEGLFRGVNALNPATARAVEESVYATTGPDSASRQQEEVNSFKVVGSATGGLVERTISAVVLHCDPIHAPSVTPGPAVVTAFIERGDGDVDDNDLDGDISDNDDLVVKTTVTVVGPPAANGVTVTAAPSTLACGEKATITVDVRDSIGQPVSDHTWVEAVTNSGGVLAGTGAVAGQAGLVTPVSSTIAETFGGKVTFYLLTSTAHVGKYEVVVTTGGGGGVTGQLANGGNTTNLLGGLFTTPPISVQVTVECTVPTVAAPAAPTPSTSGPTTGQGIRPPSTGDAGLASTSSNSWVFGAVAAVVGSLVVAGFALNPVRKD